MQINFVPVEKKGKPQIPDLAIRSGRLFVNESAFPTVKDHLFDDGEFLPVTFEQGNGYLLNILKIAEDLDLLDKSSNAASAR